MLTNEQQLVKDRRFTRPNTNIEEYGGFQNLEQIMSSRIQAAKASRVNIEQTTAGSSQNHYGGLTNRTKSVFSYDGDNEQIRNKSVGLIRQEAGRNKFGINSNPARFQTPQILQMNYKAAHTFSQEVLTLPQTQTMPSKKGSMAQLLPKNRSVLERMDPQLLKQQSNAKVFSSPHLQKQRIIEITSKNSRIQLTRHKQEDPMQLATRMNPSWKVTKDNIAKADSDSSENQKGFKQIELEKKTKKNQFKQMAIWQQIKQQDSQHQDIPFYMTAEHYQDWQQRAQTPPSPSVSEKVRKELTNKALEAQQVKEDQEGSEDYSSKSEVSQLDKKNFASLVKKQQQKNTHGSDLIDMIEADRSENSLDEEEERKFAELKRIVNNPMQERQTQFDYQTKKNLDYFGVVLPGTQKDQQEYQRKYTDVLMHKYRVSMHRKKDFLNQVKRKNGLTPLQKLKQTQATMLKHGITQQQLQPAELARKVFERLKDREEDMFIEDRRNKSIEQLYQEKEKLQGLKISEFQMKDSLIAENKFLVSTFGQKLLVDLSHNPAMVGRSERRDGVLGSLRETTQKIMKANKLIHRLSVKPQMEEEESEEVEDQKELFYESRLKQKFYNSLKLNVYPCKDEQVNQEFQSSCLLVNQVLGLPAMTKITQDGTLSLVGYKLNSGLCQNLGNFLAKHTTQRNPYLVRKLILDDNFMKDADLAALLKGIAAQRRLESLSYSQNELGSCGLVELRRLVEMQLEQRASKRTSEEEAPPLLQSLKLNCCKVKGECLNGVSKMIDEIQLHLKSLRLSDQRIGSAFPATLEAIRGQQNLQYLNLSNSNLKPVQMVTLLHVLAELKTLHTLILSSNPVPPQNPDKTPNKIHQEFMQILSQFMLSQDQLTLLNISNMLLGFESLLEFCHKAITPALQSLHLSGNDISDFQMQMLLSVMGVSMRKLEENREVSATNEIYVEVDNFGRADLVKYMDKKNFNNDKFINVQTILNSFACKNQMLKHQEAKSNDGMGFGRAPISTFDTNCTLNRGVKANWQIVNNCFITKKYRYCVLFLEKSQYDHQQSFFTTISKSSEATYQMEAQIAAGGFQKSEVPVLLGGLVLNQSAAMKEMISFWEELQSSLPSDFRLNYPISSQTYLRFRQDLVQKLEAVGYIDPLLINAPSIQSEHNEDGMLEVLANYFVYAGYVPPGKHSVLIKTKARSDNYLQKNIVIEPNNQDYLRPLKLVSEPADSFLRDWILETHEERVHKLTFLMENWTAKEIFEEKTNKKQIVEMLARNYNYLRSFQLELAARAEPDKSFYPFVELRQWAQLLQGAGVLMPQPHLMHTYSLSNINSSFSTLLAQEPTPELAVLNKPEQTFTCSQNENCLILHESKESKENREIKEIDNADPDMLMPVVVVNPTKQLNPKLATGERYSSSSQKFVNVETVGFIQNIFKIVLLNNRNQGDLKDIVNCANLQDALDQLARLRKQLNSKMAHHLELGSLFEDTETLQIFASNQPHTVKLFLKLTSAKRRFNFDSISRLQISGVETSTLQECFARAKMFSQEPVVLQMEEHSFWLRELDFTEFQVFLALAAHFKTTKPTRAKPVVEELGLAKKLQNQLEELFKTHLGLKMPVKKSE